MILAALSDLARPGYRLHRRCVRGDDGGADVPGAGGPFQVKRLGEWIRQLVADAIAQHAEASFAAQSKLDQHRASRLAALETASAKYEPARVHCTKCGGTDHMLVCEYQGTRRLSCCRCDRVFSVSHDGTPFEHHARSLPYSPQIPEPRTNNEAADKPPFIPKRPDAPLPRPRPMS